MVDPAAYAPKPRTDKGKRQADVADRALAYLDTTTVGTLVLAGGAADDVLHTANAGTVVPASSKLVTSKNGGTPAYAAATGVISGLAAIPLKVSVDFGYIGVTAGPTVLTLKVLEGVTEKLTKTVVAAGNLVEDSISLMGMIDDYAGGDITVAIADAGAGGTITGVNYRALVEEA